MDDIAATPAPTTFLEHIETVNILPGISHQPQGTSRPGTSHIRPGSGKPKPRHSMSAAQCGDQFFTYSESKASWTRKLVPLQIASRASQRIGIRLGRRNGTGSCATGGIHRPVDSFEVISHREAIRVPISLHVCCVLISVTTLWETIIGRCMGKGRSHRAISLYSQSGGKMTNKLHIF